MFSLQNMKQGPSQIPKDKHELVKIVDDMDKIVTDHLCNQKMETRKLVLWFYYLVFGYNAVFHWSG